MPASQAHAGTRARRSSQVSLAQAGRQLLRLGIVGADADVGGGLGHLTRHGVMDSLAARRLLERRDVEVGDPLEGMLRRGELERGGTHRCARLVVASSRSSSAASVSTSRSSGATLTATVVGQLGEPADVGDDERNAGRERADDGARRLAHRRRAQRDDDVARLHERPEPLLVDVALARHSLRRLEIGEPARGAADEQQPRLGEPLAEPRERRVAAAGCACSRSGGRSSRSSSPLVVASRDRAATPGAGCARSGPRSLRRARLPPRTASGRRGSARAGGSRPRAGSPAACVSQSGGMRLSSTP